MKVNTIASASATCYNNWTENCMLTQFDILKFCLKAWKTLHRKTSIINLVYFSSIYKLLSIRIITSFFVWTTRVGSFSKIFNKIDVITLSKLSVTCIISQFVQVGCTVGLSQFISVAVKVRYYPSMHPLRLFFRPLMFSGVRLCYPWTVLPGRIWKSLWTVS